MPSNFAAREAILAELRGRKLLKYLFADDPDASGAYGYVDASIDLQSQHEIADALARAALAASPTANDTDTAIPGGWKLVPVEPTGDMVAAGSWTGPDRMADWDDVLEDASQRWAAMLAASPKPDTDTPVDPGVEGVQRDDAKVAATGSVEGLSNDWWGVECSGCTLPRRDCECN